MRTAINQTVTMDLLIDDIHRLVAPKRVLRNGKKYHVAELGFYRRFRNGRGAAR